MKHDVTRVGRMCTVAVILLSLSWVPARAVALDELTFTLTAPQSYEAPALPLASRAVRLPGLEGEDLEKAAATSVSTFTRSIVARGKTYKFTMVGSDPFVKNAPKVVVPMQIIPVRFELDNGTVFDPTLPSPNCAGGGSALSRVLESPLIQTASYGDGKRQYEEEVRRLEFWSLTGATGAINPAYSVRVSAAVLPTLIVKLHGFPAQAVTCGQIAFIDINTWDDLVEKQILPALHGRVNPRTFPLFLFLNVVMFDGNPKNCCFFGYHNAFNFLGGVQTYGVADYDVSQALIGFEDIAALAHELAEWYDDPFVNNPTPPWGHVGQVPDCQDNLEVGDPLSGTLHAITMPNGFTYHPQELAFFSWFYNQTPSLGFKGWYSSGGTFRSPARLCK